MNLIDLIEEELQAYRETGRAIHLAHALRALDEMRKTIQRTQLDGFKPARRECDLVTIF